MKKLLLILLALALISLTACAGFSLPPIGGDGEEGGGNGQPAEYPEETDTSLFTFEATEGGYTLKKYNGTEAVVVIPETYESEPVVHIGVTAFYGNATLTEVVIPASVRIIDFSVFWDCKSLSRVTFFGDSQLTEVRAHAFQDCDALTEISFARCPLTKLGVEAFSFCDNLKKVVLPDPLTAIDDNAFSNCPKLAEVTIPANLEKIGQFAFSNCFALASIRLPSTLTKMGQHTFSQCSALREIRFDGSQSAWNAVEKGSGWAFGVGDGCTVYFTNGNITL